MPKTPFIGYDNRFADAVPVASSTASGAAANLADFRPYTFHKPAAIPYTVTVDCGVAKSADKLCVYNHNLFSNGCTVEVRGSTDNFATSDVLLHSYTPTSDKPFIRDFTSASYRYWRSRITGATAPTLTIMAIGVGLEFPTGLPYGFDPLTSKVFGQINISQQGWPLGSAILFEQWAQLLNFPYVPSAWIRSTFIPARKAHLRGSPFLFAWDLTNYPDDIYLVMMGDNFKAPLKSPVYSMLSFDVKGVALT
ncbi:MAG: hypothetical protein B7Y04_00555 [Gallionellales bacterium 24-53-125]|nr:MAG: hypothetical protein B7Y04_00555 [Gallionellales bacterium 24-53-125]